MCRCFAESESTILMTIYVARAATRARKESDLLGEAASEATYAYHESAAPPEAVSVPGILPA